MMRLRFYQPGYCGGVCSERIGARAIIEREGRVLFSYLALREQYLFPGGGLEKGETPQEGAVRECLEECGLIIAAEEPFLVIDEYYAGKHWQNYYSRASILGAADTRMDEKEVELGLCSRWVGCDEIERNLRTMMNWNDLDPDAVSSIYAVRNSHYRELCAWRLLCGLGLPPVPASLAETLGHIEMEK